MTLRSINLASASCRRALHSLTVRSRALKIAAMSRSSDLHGIMSGKASFVAIFNPSGTYLKSFSFQSGIVPGGLRHACFLDGER